MILYHDDGVTVSREGIHIFINGTRFGFLMKDDEGKTWIVCHRPRVEKLRDECGFYIPAPLLKAKNRFLFEVHRGQRFTHYHFDPNVDKGRMIISGSDIFCGIGRMKLTPEAVHITRPRVNK